MNIKYMLITLLFLCACHVKAMFLKVPTHILPKEYQQALLNEELAKSIRKGKTQKAIALIDAGAQIEGFDPKTHVRPLVTAITWNRLGLISELVARGARIDETFSLYKGNKHPQLLFYGTPLQYAASKNNAEAIELMLWTIPQSLTKTLPETPPKDIIAKHLEFLTALLTQKVQEFRDNKTGWCTALPADHVSNTAPSQFMTKKKQAQHVRIISLLSPQTIGDHKEHIAANLNKYVPKTE